jgi:hypothetical protein
MQQGLVGGIGLIRAHGIRRLRVDREGPIEGWTSLTGARISARLRTVKYLGVVGLDKPLSRMGLGNWQFGSREWGCGEGYSSQEAAIIVQRAVHRGITLFDTAWAHG